jgi:hypothetical protein
MTGIRMFGRDSIDVKQGTCGGPGTCARHATHMWARYSRTRSAQSQSGPNVPHS